MELFLNVLVSLVLIACGAALIVRWVKSCAAPRRPLEDSKVPVKELALVFAAAIGFRIFSYGLSVVLAGFINPGASMPGEMVRWDALHYINLAEKGYAGYQENGAHLFLVFFPLYTWVLRFFTGFIPNAAAAGILVSSLCYALGCCWLYALCCKRYKRAVAVLAVLFISVFPFSFFFGGIMTEGLFFMLTAAALYYISQHRWTAAGCFGLLAALTRMNGFLLIFAAGAELLEAYGPLGRTMEREKLKAVLKRLPAVFMPLLGTLCYLGLNFYVDGNPLAFLTHQKHWSQGAMWISNTLTYLTKNIGDYAGQSINLSVWIPELVIFILFFALVVISIPNGKNPNFILIFAFLSLISNYSLSWLLSAGRYVSAVPAFFILMAGLVEKKKLLAVLLGGCMLALYGLYFWGFLSGMQIM